MEASNPTPPDIPAEGAGGIRMSVAGENGNDEKAKAEKPSDDRTATTDEVLEMTPIERIFLAETTGIRRRLDRANNTLVALQVIAATGVILLVVLYVRNSKGASVG